MSAQKTQDTALAACLVQEKVTFFYVMICFKTAIAITAVIALGGSPLLAKDSKGKSATKETDLSELRNLIEQQSKEIQALTDQVNHLAQVIESCHSAAAAPAQASPTPVTQQQPVTESTTPAPSISGTAAAEAAGTHIVTKGETLTSIAKHNKVTVGDLLKVNKIADDRKLQIGQTLIIPTPTPIPSASATPTDNPQEKKETH